MYIIPEPPDNFALPEPELYECRGYSFSEEQAQSIAANAFRQGVEAAIAANPPAGKKAAKAKAGEPPKPTDVADQTWIDFLAVRKTKKAPLTPTALAQIVAAAAKAGYTLEAALQMCCERGWQAFRADWVTPQKSPRGGSLSGMNYGDRDGHFNQ